MMSSRLARTMENVIPLLFVVGRIIFGGYFLMMGVTHVMKNAMLTGYAASKGVPAARLAVYGTGLMLLGGGLGVLLGVYVQWAVLLLVVFLVVVSFKMHNFWAVSDPNMKMAEMTNFLKNMALAGAALMLPIIQVPWYLSVLF